MLDEGPFPPWKWTMSEQVDWEEVRHLIKPHTGQINSARQVNQGHNSEVSAVINESTFVKGLRVDHPWVWTQARERAINPYIRHVSAGLLWYEASDGWDLNGFEYIHGRPANYAVYSKDLEPIVFMMDSFPTAPDDAMLKRAEQRWSAYTERPELFAGKHLCHTDFSPGNVLINGDRAYMVDWAWPTIGAQWLDAACWTVWLIAYGHTPRQAESWAKRIPAFREALEESITTFAEAQAAMWEDIGDRAPHPKLVTAAADWVRYR